MNYLKNRIIFPSALGALALTSMSLQAGEYTVSKGSFEQVIKAEASAVPTESHAISLVPEVWSSMKIKKFITHGTAVKKGDKLMWLDTESIDKKIEDTVKERVKQRLLLKKAEMELAELKITTEESLAKAKLKFDRFIEDYEYYKNVQKPQKAADTAYGVTRAKNFLSYTQEEFDQLMKMYDEDGLTEETEEIIIQRSKHSLIAAERSLKKVERDAELQTKVKSVRVDADWKTSAITKKRELMKAQRSLPIALKLKELDFAKQQESDAKAEEYLADLKADRKMMEVVSPVDGVVYYGAMKKGKWSSDAALKMLRIGGSIPANLNFMTVVPNDGKMKFNAFLTEKQIALFSAEVTGKLRLMSDPWKPISVSPESVSDTPSLALKWKVSFIPATKLPANVSLNSKASVSMVISSEEEVLTVPRKAVKSHPNGTHTVNLKMAEGDPEETEVVIGRSTSDKLEILSGLENGQVIITP